RLALSGAATTTTAGMDRGAMENVAKRPPREVLPPHAARPEAVGGGHVEVDAIRRSHGTNPRTGGIKPMREWWSKIRRAVNLRRGLHDDLGEEIRSHLDFLIEENIARGMPPDEARAAAKRHFGNQTAVRERAREAWQFPGLETILQDLRYGLRGIRKS